MIRIEQYRHLAHLFVLFLLVLLSRIAPGLADSPNMSKDKEANGGSPSNSSWEPVKHLVAGTTAGLVSTVALYPLDLIKVRYQAMLDGPAPYSSLLGGIKQVARKEGWRALYSGMGPALLGSGVSWGGYFYCYENAKKRYRGGGGAQRLGAGHHLLAAAEAGALLVLLTNPIWLIKTRLQLQVREGGARAGHHYAGPLDALRTILREEGPRGLYRGLGPALGLVAHGALNFAAYEALKRRAGDGRGRRRRRPGRAAAAPSTSWLGEEAADIIQHLTLGSVSKIFASTITYPAQVIKTRLQLRGTAKDGFRGQSKYKGAFDCAATIFREEGPRGFFKGCLANGLRVAPSAAITFLVYEESIKILRGNSNSRKLQHTKLVESEVKGSDTSSKELEGGVGDQNRTVSNSKAI
mmetsp:Transcript_5791/g.9596  ORF Transcript_5791/g.9596 Transcript_5791/m.9596 type:complete len:409 (+) Transcript_5791:92-1318(+)